MEKKILGYYDYTVLLTYMGMISGVSGIALVMHEKNKKKKIFFFKKGVFF